MIGKPCATSASVLVASDHSEHNTNILKINLRRETVFIGAVIKIRVLAPSARRGKQFSRRWSRALFTGVIYSLPSSRSYREYNAYRTGRGISPRVYILCVVTDDAISIPPGKLYDSYCNKLVHHFENNNNITIV